MTFDWNAISSIATAAGSFFTAMGVMYGAWQIRLSKKQSQAEFEDRLDAQYRALAYALPVDILIGGLPANDSEKKDIRELIYN